MNRHHVATTQHTYRYTDYISKSEVNLYVTWYYYCSLDNVSNFFAEVLLQQEGFISVSYRLLCGTVTKVLRQKIVSVIKSTAIINIS